MSRAIAAEVLRSATYMTIASADADGAPWASPVYYAPSEDLRALYWVSLPGARHSRNVAERPEVALSVFDSHAAPGSGQGVYLEATAAEAAGDVLDRGVEIFDARTRRHGLPGWDRDRVTGGAPHRLYRAVVMRCWILDQDHPGPGDHRVEVEL